MEYRVFALACLYVQAAGLSASRASDTFFLNTFGENNHYTIMRFERDGLPVPAWPVIGRHNDGGIHSAWPSALKVNGKERVYASRHDGQRWNDIGIWESSDGANFTFVSTALTASSTEPLGIGPAQVYYAAEDLRPFKLIYLIRGTPIGTSFGLATSNDGLVWQREGVVYEVSQNWEAAGGAPSFVTRTTWGQWVLAFQAYETIDKGNAAIAIASSANGPFKDPRLIMEPINSRFTVTGAKRLIAQAEVSGPVRIGEPYLLRSRSTRALEIVRPVRQNGSTLYFDRPLASDFGSPADLVHVGSRKVDPSYIWQGPDGSWHGYWTAYGAFDQVTSEYTFEVKAPSLTGPWTPEARGVVFSPWHMEGLFSTENPTPLTAVP
jgi:hypothetical protein